MKLFNVYGNPASGRYYAVKSGFGWPAFFFTVIWAYGYRLYLVAALGFIVVLTRVVLENILDTQANYIVIVFEILMLIFAVIFGAYGNEWRSNNLVKRGFHKLGTRTAKNSIMAVELQLERNATEIA